MSNGEHILLWGHVFSNNNRCVKYHQERAATIVDCVLWTKKKVN